ncbi:MAG: DUF4469 domain-containing protein [Flavobacteriaceae bacterium]|jgi:hypothetical protein|nr:DUF4469 domain-containing protein [Flavobacteriaceae bacterium]
MSTLHTIKCYLYDNVLTEDPNDFIARVASERSLSVKDVCTSAATRGGADVSAAAMEHAVNLWLKEMAYNLCDGFSVNTGYFVANAHIRGVFGSPEETFDKTKHTLSFDFVQGSQLRRELGSVMVEILGIADASLSIAQVIDVKTGSVNDLLTPNRNLRIAGSKLKIAGENTDCGIYFINQTTGERTKVDATEIVTNNPSELIIIIPELAAGTYKVEVTTQFGGNSKQLLKDPRTATFDKILTVA